MRNPEPSVKAQVVDAIMDVVIFIPPSHEKAVYNPAERAQAVARQAARNASLMAGSLALPLGPFGWLTVLPEMVGVWKLQSQMVSDIASIYGKSSALGREQMIYCLFKQVAAQLMRDVVVRVGERVLVQQASMQLLQSVAQVIGVKITQSVINKSASRFVPLLGAVGVGAYAYFDTLQVAKNAVELFERETVFDPAQEGMDSAASAKSR
jgi:uncharacterized protein (DUF697 family)